MREAQDALDEAFLAEQKRRQPRAKKRFKPLPEDVHNEIYEKHREPFMALYKQFELYKELLNEQLDKLAHTVLFIRDPCVMNRVKVSCSSTFSSQGYGAHTYAKGALLPLKATLDKLGFTTHIRAVVITRGRTAIIGDPYVVTDYELWADAPHWMVCAAKYKQTITEAANLLAKERLHPQVIYPLAYNVPAVKNPNW